MRTWIGGFLAAFVAFIVGFNAPRADINYAPGFNGGSGGGGVTTTECDYVGSGTITLNTGAANSCYRGGVGTTGTSNIWYVTITGNTTFALAGAIAGQPITLSVLEQAPGGYTVAFDGVTILASGTICQNQTSNTTTNYYLQSYYNGGTSPGGAVVTNAYGGVGLPPGDNLLEIQSCGNATTAQINLNLTQAAGGVLFGNGTSNALSSVNNTSTTLELLTETGLGAVGASPVFQSLATLGIPSTSQTTTWTAALNASLGFTSSGAATILNANDNHAVQIANGTNTSTVSIGGGTNNVELDNVVSNTGTVNIENNSTNSGTVNICANPTTNTCTVAEGNTGSTIGIVGTNVNINNIASNANTTNIAAGSTNSGTVHINDGATANTSVTNIGFTGGTINATGTVQINNLSSSSATTSINNNGSNSGTVNIKGGGTPSGTVHICDNATANTCVIDIGNTGGTINEAGTWNVNPGTTNASAANINNAASDSSTVSIKGGSSTSGTVHVCDGATSNTCVVDIGFTGSTVAVVAGTTNIDNIASFAGTLNIAANASNTGTIHIDDNATSNGSTISIGATGATTNINGATVKLTALATSSAAQTGTVCSGTGGLLTVDTTTTCLASSGRFKERIAPLNEGLAAVMALKPVSYFYRSDFNGPTFAHDPNFNGPQVGFVAEDVAQVDPRLVTVEPDGQLRSVRYLQMTALLARAIQDLQHEVEDGAASHGSLGTHTSDDEAGDARQPHDPQLQALADQVHRQQIEILVLVVWCLALTGFVVFKP